MAKDENDSSGGSSSQSGGLLDGGTEETQDGGILPVAPEKELKIPIPSMADQSLGGIPALTSGVFGAAGGAYLGSEVMSKWVSSILVEDGLGTIIVEQALRSSWKFKVAEFLGQGWGKALGGAAGGTLGGLIGYGLSLGVIVGQALWAPAPSETIGGSKGSGRTGRRRKGRGTSGSGIGGAPGGISGDLEGVVDEYQGEGGASGRGDRGGSDYTPRGLDNDYTPDADVDTYDYSHDAIHASRQGLDRGSAPGGSYGEGGGAYGDFGVYSGGIQQGLDQMDQERKQQQEDQKRRDQQKETEKEDEKSDSSDSGDDWDEESEDSSGDTSPGPAADNGGGNPSSSGYDDGDSGDYYGGPNLKAIRVSKTAKASVHTRYGILLASIGGGEVSSDDQSGWGGTHPNADEGDSGGGVRPGAIGKKKPGERGGGKKKNAKDLLGGDTATDGWTGVHPKVYGISVGSVGMGSAAMARRVTSVRRTAR
jgi:hypothetical protein